MSRSRSRSRSHALPADGPALRPIADNRWGRVGPEPDHPHEPNRTLVWSSAPTLHHIRRVLILVDLQQVRQVMEEQFSDAMTATRILTLPDLQDSEELGMFTYARPLNPGHLQATNSGALYSLVLVNTSFTHGASTLARMGLHQLSPARTNRTSCVCHVIRLCHQIIFRDCFWWENRLFSLLLR